MSQTSESQAQGQPVQRVVYAGYKGKPYNLTPANHNGVDERARVPVIVQGGAWKLLK